MENFSKNKQPKRGRPRLLDPGWEAYLARTYSEVGPRSVQNAAYALKTLGFAKDVPEFAWLIELTPGERFKRWTLMCELGRIEDEAARIEAARWLCKERPTVRIGVAILRRWRKSLQGKDWQSKSDVLQLCTEIAKLLDDFCLRYPGTTPAMIKDALEFCKPSNDDE